jgi:hypothetical protein
MSAFESTRRQFFRTTLAGIPILATAQTSSIDVTAIQPALDFARATAIDLVSAVKTWSVPPAVSARFVMAHRIAVTLMQQIHAVDAVDGFLRSPAGKAQLLAPATSGMRAQFDQWGGILGLLPGQLNPQAPVTESEYAALATAGTTAAFLAMLDAWETNLSPLLPAVFRRGKPFGLWRVQTTNPPPPPPPPQPPPVPSLCQIANQLNAVAGALGLLAAAWGAGALVTAGACIPCSAAAAVFGIGSGATWTGSAMLVLYGAC